MAEVDFSNARIEPYSAENNTQYANLNLADGIYGRNWSIIVASGTGQITRLINEKKQLMYLYQGTFSASGTELFVSGQGRSGQWRVSNISFNSGDTYVFQINATLTCN